MPRSPTCPTSIPTGRPEARSPSRGASPGWRSASASAPPEGDYDPRVSQGRPINVADFEALAEEACEPGYWGYLIGGAGDEITLRDNVEAFRRRQLRPRMLVDVSEVTTRMTVLGKEISMPLMVAPTSLQRITHPDGEPALASAAAEAGTVYTLSSLGGCRPRELADALGGETPRWFQLYWSRDRDFTKSL